MRYNTLINNVKASEWGLNLSLAYLFAWLYELPSWAEKVTIGNDVYYFASRNKACEELSLLTDKKDTMYRYYKKLVDLGLIRIKKIDNKDYINLTDKAKTWNDAKHFLSETSEKNPNSEKNPTYNINKNNDINNINNNSCYRETTTTTKVETTNVKTTNVKTTNVKTTNETKRFQKPTLDELEDYLKKRKSTVGAEQFFNYYESKGWMIGKNKMKDWKAAVRTWEFKDKENLKDKKEKEYKTPMQIIMEKHNLKL
jgi:hypothetical protein